MSFGRWYKSLPSLRKPEPTEKIWPRTCLFCSHYRFTAGWAGTDITPGDPDEMDCQRGHWYRPTRAMYEDITEETRSKMMIGVDCPDFEDSMPDNPEHYKGGSGDG